MVLLVLMLAVLIVPSVGGGAALSPLPVRDGCYLVSPEINVLRVAGEAIILSFPMFERVLEVHNIAPPTAKYLITKGNGTQGGAYHGEGRVQQRDNQLWLLPAQAADSGEYICTYRNETYCVTGSIGLHVYEAGSADVEKLSYPIPVSVGEYLRLSCPSLSDFNSTDRLIEWHKDSGLTPRRSGRVQASFQQHRGKLLIPAVRRSHAGVYTCRLRALIDDQQYKVSRTVVLNVEGVDPVTTTTTTTIDPITTTTTDPVTTTEPELSGTSDPGLTSSSFVSVHTIQPPVILSPRNGTVFESLHGSGLELSCTVLTECQTADYTVVTWLVNNQSVESSYLDGRALQGGRRVTGASEGCRIELRLVVVMMTDEDVNAELRCVAQNRAGRQEVVIRLQLQDSTFTWLVVAAVTASCFLTVVSVFLYVLFKPHGRNKADYFLARQNSSF